jgi:DNA-binding Xre family transcriptional regulator
MTVQWNLKRWLAIERNIYRPSELRTLLLTKTGVKLSLQAVSSLVNGTPGALRLRTIQALCNALDCKLSDFCEVFPDADEGQQQRQEGIS